MRTAILGCCLALFTQGLIGQPKLSLSDAIEEAVAKHPLVAEGQARSEASLGLRHQAELKPNPRIILQSENSRFWSQPSLTYSRDTDNFGYLAQIFETAGKRERRMEVADAVVRRTELERQVTARQITARVSLAYWSAAAASELAELMRQDINNFDAVVQYHRDRVREGAMAELDLLRILLERDRLAVTLENAQQEASRAKLILQREMGRQEFSEIALTSALGEIREVPAPDIASAVAARPEDRVVQQSIAQAQSNLRLQHALAKPDPEVLFGYKRTAGFDTLLGGFQINLPVRNRNQGAIETAAADIRVAQAQKAILDRQLRSEITIAYSEYLNRKRLLTQTIGPMRTRADEVARIVMGAYREGGIDLLRLLDAERTRIETNVMYYRALAEYQQSFTALQIAVGGRL